MDWIIRGEARVVSSAAAAFRRKWDTPGGKLSRSRQFAARGPSILAKCREHAFSIANCTAPPEGRCHEDQKTLRMRSGPAAKKNRQTTITEPGHTGWEGNGPVTGHVR